MNPSGENGADINRKGKIIIRELRKYLIESEDKPPLVLSWQNTKLAIDKTINDVTVADLGGSYAMAQVAATIWMIIKERKGKKRWQLKILAGRERYDEEHDIISVKDEQGNFNLLD